jgi:hypothetical protein
MQTTEPTHRDWNERARAQFLDPNEAMARIMERPESKRLARAEYMLSIARNPRGIFDLELHEISLAVIALLEQYIATLAPARDAALLELARAYVELDAAGDYCQETIWRILANKAEPLGMGYGCGALMRQIVTGARK